MALTLRRWLTIAVLACAAIAVWQLPARGANERAGPQLVGRFVPDYGVVRRYGWPGITTRVQEAAWHLRILELRDSVFTPRAIAGATPGLHVLVDRQLPDSLKAAITQVVTETWQGYDPGSRYPVLVAWVQDTTRAVDGVAFRSPGFIDAEVFPPDARTPVCRVLTRFPVALSGRHPSATVVYLRRIVSERLVSRSSGRSLLGPCAMYATFGRPGAGVDAWLTRTAWRTGRSIDWSHRSPRPQDDVDARYEEAGPAVDFFGVAGPAWRLRADLSDDGIACLAGHAERCVASVERPAVVIPGEEPWQQSVIDVRSPVYGWRWESGSLGPDAPWILSDMVRDLGRQRFQQFWTSEDSLSVAFAQAAGRPLGDWLKEWAQRTYGTEVLGPSIPVRGRVAGILVLLAAVGVAVVFASERRVV
jgi:hypothetical protein